MKIWTMIAAVFLLTTDRAQTANALRELVRPHESNETHFYEALDRTLKKEKNSGVDWAPLTASDMYLRTAHETEHSAR